VFNAFTSGAAAPGAPLDRSPVRHVLVGIPFTGHWVTDGIARFAEVCGHQSALNRDVKFTVKLLSGSSVISFNVEFMRNCIVGMVLADPTVTDLWFIDSDTQPSINAMSLLRHDADIVAGVYPIPDAEVGQVWSAYEPAGEIYRKMTTLPDAPFEAGGAGTGAMLIKRKVLADARMRLGMGKEGEPPWVFRTVRSGSGACEMTDDLDFCLRARKAGYHILVDPSVRFGHVKEYLYGERHK